MAGVLLLVGIWGVTGAMSVPAHDRLQFGYRREPFQLLMRSNFLRTALWTARGVVVVAMVVTA